MKWLCNLGILKGGFSACSSLVMLISRNVTKGKRLVTDFRHLNKMIAQNNLAYPSLKNTFSILGSSKCEVSPVQFERCIPLFEIIRKLFKRYCGILPYFGSTTYLYQRMPMELSISPSIW